MFSKSKKLAVFNKTDGLCFYCGCVAAGIDHIVPQSKGGKHNIENLVGCCVKCNCLKGDMDIERFRLKIKSSLTLGKFQLLFWGSRAVQMNSELLEKDFVFWGEAL